MNYISYIAHNSKMKNYLVYEMNITQIQLS